MVAPLISIDPGVNGCSCIRTSEGIFIYHFKKPAEWCDWLLHLDSIRLQATALLEKVWARPASGDRANFQSGQGKMMEQYGRVQGIMEALGITFETITAKGWQKEAGITYPDNCDYSGRKRVHAAHAKTLFPDLKVTQTNADAIIILSVLEKR